MALNEPMRLCAALYGFSLAYLFAPTTFDSVSVVEYLHTLPDAVKYLGKTIFAAPLMYHTFNGIRHLSWDVTKCESYSYCFLAFSRANGGRLSPVLTIKSVYTSGYVVLGATTLSTIALLFM